MISRMRSVAHASALRAHRSAPASRFAGGSSAIERAFPAQSLFSSIHSLHHASRNGSESDMRATPLRSVTLPMRLSPSCALLMASMRAPIMLGSSNAAGRQLAVGGTQICCFSSRHDPRQSGSNDWVATAKAGALVAIGVGALVASTSLAFGFFIAGAAGYGVYSLYQKLFGPYRSRHSSNDVFGGVDANIDRLNDLFGRKQPSRSGGSAAASGGPSDGAMGQRELDALVQGLPLVVRGLVKTIFSFVGKAMQSSMQRAGELRRLANEHVQSHPRVIAQMGSGVSVSTPQQWMESTVNGVGRVEAVFPVSGSSRAQVTVKASVGQSGGVTLQELKFRNFQTGEVIDLLRDGGAGPRKTVIDAEYVEI